MPVAALVATSQLSMAQVEVGDVFVDAITGSDLNLGNSWGAPLETIQAALAMAGQDDEIWVRDNPASPYYVGPIVAPRSSTFLISQSGIKLRGGFKGNEMILSDRGVVPALSTVLSGDINRDSLAGTITDDAYRVVTIPAATTLGVEVDGFTIEYGNADGALGTDTARGAGIGTGQAPGGFTDLELRNLTVQNCRAREKGSAIYLYRVGGGDCVGVRVTIRENLCFGDGSLYLEQCGNTPDPSLRWFNGVFTNNRSSRGGGVFNERPNGAVAFQNCLWFDNLATEGGGYASNVPNRDILAHCTFSFNQAVIPAGVTGGGSAVSFINGSGGTATITSSILHGNSQTQLVAGGTPVITPGTVQAGSTVLSAQYSDIELDPVLLPPGGGTPPIWFGIGSISVPPQFSNPATRDFTLLPASPCLDVADDTALMTDTGDLDFDSDVAEIIPFDLGNQAREEDIPGVGGGVPGGGVPGAVISDMGCFERIPQGG